MSEDNPLMDLEDDDADEDEQNEDWFHPQSELYHTVEVKGSHGGTTGMEDVKAHICRPNDPYTVKVSTHTHKTMKGYVDKHINLVTMDGEKGRPGYSRWQSAVASFRVRPGSHEACPLCGDGEAFHDDMFIAAVTEADFLDDDAYGDYSFQEQKRRAVLAEACQCFSESYNSNGSGTAELCVSYYSELNDIWTHIDLRKSWMPGPHQFSLGGFVDKHPFLEIENVRQREHVSDVEVGDKVNDNIGANHRVNITGSIDSRQDPGWKVELKTHWDEEDWWDHPSDQEQYR